MARKKEPPDTSESLKNAVELLRFALSLDDEEILRSTIEGVIELLEDEISTNTNKEIR